MFTLFDLAPYLTWDCPLNDSSYAATLGRIIISYLGKQEITLTMVGYQKECNDLKMLRRRKTRTWYSPPTESVMFRYGTSCISTNGSFYLIEDKYIKTHDHVFVGNDRWGPRFDYRWSKDWRYKPDPKNLNYISDKDINHTNSMQPITSSEDGTMAYQKYFQTMNIPQLIEGIPVKAIDEKDLYDTNGIRRNDRNNTTKKQIKIDRICVVDLKEENQENTDTKCNDEKDEKDIKQGNDAKNKSDFGWKEPMEQLKNTAMVFVLNNQQVNVFINEQELNFENKDNDKILDIWQCNKCVYLITQSTLYLNQFQLQLIQLRFVKEKKTKRGRKQRYEIKHKIQFRVNAVITQQALATNKDEHKEASDGKEKCRSFINGQINIRQNCNYFDSKCQTLLTVENMKIRSHKNSNKKNKNGKKNSKRKSETSQHGGIVFRLISNEKHQVQVDYLGRQSKKRNISPKNGKPKAKSKSKSKLQESKTRLAKSPVVKTTPTKYEQRTVIDEIKFQSLFLNLLFKQSKCHFLFHHKVSNTSILMLKIVENVNININININDSNSSEKNDLKGNDSYIDNSNTYGNMNNFQSNLSDIDTLDRFLEWKKNLIKYNNGRLLVQLKIDFLKKQVISAKIANIIINENKCRIIGYDSLRSMIIYDTLPTAQRQYKVLSSPEKNELSPRDKWDYEKVQVEFSYDMGGGEARIHNYRMMRLNDIVDKWIDLCLC